MTTELDRTALDPAEESALRKILEGTATATGEAFFRALVRNLADVLGTHGAWVTEYLEETRRLRALAFRMGDGWIDDYDICIDGTPCEEVVDGARLVHYPENIVALFPEDQELVDIGAVAYMGVPLLDVDGRVLGHLAVIHKEPMPEEPRMIALFQIFAARAAAELRRMRAEAVVREREEKLSRLVGSAMDAIVELDSAGRITHVNIAAEKVFGCYASEMLGAEFHHCIVENSRERLRAQIEHLATRPDGERYCWIPGGLEVRRPDGSVFPAEATLSHYEMNGKAFHTLILRDVKERLEAEKRIQSLTEQTEYLQEELKTREHFDEVIGQSAALRRVLDEVTQVASTGATVLILGETGTGKELIARAIHRASPRSDQPFVCVNCAAVPAHLIESEFFGHEAGAFTGATKKRQGRFAVADGGTIFLDEIGELPVDLQPKLLRALQQGSFEPVGSDKTHTVDVRVIAATNRDLERAVRDGEFREDLYYRLNVFPISVPPLRERREDIVHLAQAFAQRIADRIGRRLEPIDATALKRLEGYSWPGNVRELENVIERAVITARDGRINLERALPVEDGVLEGASSPPTRSDGHIHTVAELQEIERANILRALDATQWRIAGEQGAAKLLGMNPSTLNSRMKALGICRPK